MKQQKGIAVTQRIENGQFVNREAVARLFLRAFKGYEGQRVEVKITPILRKRSLRQNAYYWGVVVECVRECMQSLGNDYDSDTIHDYLKARFLKARTIEDPETGKRIVLPASTTRLKKDEFSDYIESIRAWTLEFFGAHIPDDNEDVYPTF